MMNKEKKVKEEEETMGEFHRLPSRCPECGGYDLSLVVRGMRQFEVVLYFPQEVKADHMGHQVDFHDVIIRCECSDCGYLLRDDWGRTFVDERQLLNWIMDNCSQAGSKGCLRTTGIAS